MNDMKALHAKLYTPTLIAAALLEVVLIVLSSTVTSSKVGKCFASRTVLFRQPKVLRSSETIGHIMNLHKRSS